MGREENRRVEKREKRGKRGKRRQERKRLDFIPVRPFDSSTPLFHSSADAIKLIIAVSREVKCRGDVLWLL